MSMTPTCEERSPLHNALSLSCYPACYRLHILQFLNFFRVGTEEVCTILGKRTQVRPLIELRTLRMRDQCFIRHQQVNTVNDHNHYCNAHMWWPERIDDSTLCEIKRSWGQLLPTYREITIYKRIRYRNFKNGSKFKSFTKKIKIMYTEQGTEKYGMVEKLQTLRYGGTEIVKSVDTLKMWQI